MTTPTHLVRLVLQRAILTLASLPDPDLRYRLGPKTAWPAYVQETRDAYAAVDARIRVFVATSADLSLFLEANQWLSWYGRLGAQHAKTVRLFIAYTFGAPVWMLQLRASRNPQKPATRQAIHARFKRMVWTIAERFEPALKKHHVDNAYGFGYSIGHAGESRPDALADLPSSPAFIRSPGAKPYGYSHPEAIAAREREAKSARAKKRRRRRSRSRTRRKSAESGPKRRVSVAFVEVVENVTRFGSAVGPASA